MNAKLTMSNGNLGRRRGFTLIEMLVTIGIIVILAGILIPVIHSATKKASGQKMKADLLVIQNALDAYRTDFGSYPRLPLMASRDKNPDGTLVPGRDNGSQLLAWALVGPYPLTATGTLPKDGADGLGFRVRPQTAGSEQGKVFGPYIQIDKFPIVQVGSYYYLKDSFGNPIMYFAGKAGTVNLGVKATTADPILPLFPKSKQQASVYPRYGYVSYGTGGTPPSGDYAYYNLDDNYVAMTDVSDVNAPRLRMTPADPNYLGGTTTLALDKDKVRSQMQYRLEQGGDYTGQILLWSAGPDGLFFTEDDVLNIP